MKSYYVAKSTTSGLIGTFTSDQIESLLKSEVIKPDFVATECTGLSYNQLMEYATQDADPKVFEPLRKPINGSRVHIFGVAYKKDVSDMRESPALEVLDELRRRGGDVRYHDPYVPELALATGTLHSVPLGDDELAKAKRYIAGGLELRMEETRHLASWIGNQEALHDRVMTMEDALAAIDGIQNKIHPGPPLDKDLYDLGVEERSNVPQTPASLDAVLDALEKDHDFLLRGNVMTEDLLRTWIEYKRTQEADAVRLRPHPYEFSLYYDL